MRRGYYLVSIFPVESPKYVQEQLIKCAHNLVVVVINLHFQVQTGVLGKVSVGIRVLGAEDRPDFVHSPHITSNAHLFGKLRTLRIGDEHMSGGGGRKNPT